jgi:hypothetical protein
VRSQALVYGIACTRYRRAAVLTKALAPRAGGGRKIRQGGLVMTCAIAAHFANLMLSKA